MINFFCLSRKCFNKIIVNHNSKKFSATQSKYQYKLEKNLNGDHPSFIVKQNKEVELNTKIYTPLNNNKTSNNIN